MKFGRVDLNISKIDFKLPPDPEPTSALLDSLPVTADVPNVYFGGSVWTDRSLVGKLYPKGLPAKDFLSYYCQQLSAIELNTTFYGIPSIEKVLKWKEAATPGFKFCPKFPQSISHRKYGDMQREMLDRFITSVAHFEEHLGTSFLLLPSHFQPRSLSELQRLLEGVPSDFKISVELRHPIWYEDHGAQKAIFDLFQEKGVVAIITDVAGRRDVLHQTLTTDSAFIRFTGNNLHPTDYSRIDSWVEKLTDWIKRGLKEVYFLLHEPDKGQAAVLAHYFVEKLNEKAGLNLTLPTLQSPE